MPTYQAVRYHDFCAGHRVAGHESKCAHLHGHNYRVHFYCSANTEDGALPLDAIGRVIDFSAIKDRLCMWLEDNWDHKTLIWTADDEFWSAAGETPFSYAHDFFLRSVVRVPFNPTAENMGAYLLHIGAALLVGTGVRLVRVVIEETRKCSVVVEV